MIYILQLSEQKYPKISELDIDDFLITHMGGSIEKILTRGERSLVKRVIDILSAPFLLVYQYLPLYYCFYLLHKLFEKGGYTSFEIWTSIIITILFFIRILFLTIASIIESGGLIKLVKDLLEIN
jgi:hypothetical protein